MWPFKKQETIEITNGHTWDMAKLERYAHQPVFIYGTEKRRHRNHPFIDDWSEFRGTAFTTGDNWIMWKKKLGPGTFPIAMRVDQTMVPKARIKGEMFLIDSFRIKELDDIMSNGVEFRRKQVQVLVPRCIIKRIVNKDHNYEEEKTNIVTKVPAWMYVGRYKYWIDFLDAGYHFKPCTRYSPNGFVLQGDYYDFTEKEFNDD